MTVAFISDAGASKVPADNLSGPDANSCPLPTAEHEQVRHMLFGSIGGVRGAIAHLHHLSYADPNDWSRPISTGRPNEVMAILTKRIR